MKNAKPPKRRSATHAQCAAPSPGGNGQPAGDGQQFRVIVIGASAGGVEALSRVIQTLPPNLPAAIFVVLHISPLGPSVLPEILARAGRLPACHPIDGEEIIPGNIYVAPPDHHLLIKPGHIMLSRGPRENNARPAVDSLFRTAARSYGPWVVGVILSGGLDDGTLGMMDIKGYSGVTIVQDPDEAMFPSMPSSAVENVQVDRIAKLDEIGPLLTRLAREPVPSEEGAAFMARNNGDKAPDLAEIGSDDLKTRNMAGPPSKFTCPDCGGALWEIQNGKLLRYRCHVGHGYTAETLMAAQSERLEDALWSTLRALEETAGMRRRMANRARKGGWELMAKNYDEQADHAEARASLVRSVLVKDDVSNVDSRSAKTLQKKASRSRDPDAGKELARQPGTLQPHDPAHVPDPSAKPFGVQSVSRRPSAKGRTSKHKPGSAKGKAARRPESD
jgi:two-component system, chemotaxis family, protein-glutamate methylesterase/glutaminase